MKQFSNTYGFERSEVTLANWRELPFSRFAFSHVSEVVPSSFAPPSKKPTILTRKIDRAELEQSVITGETERTLGEYLEYSATDTFVLWRDGNVTAAYAAPYAKPDNPHLIFSVSKSVTGILAGILEDLSLIDTGKPVSHYMPEAAASGFGNCSLRHLLDMRASLSFVEEYLNEDGDYARYRRATNWNPTPPGQKPETLENFLFGLAKGDGGHGGSFRYLSPASDLLGLIVERVSGMRYMPFLSEVLWEPMGAAHSTFTTVDSLGAPRGAGGVSIVAEDLLRIGIMLLNDGEMDGKQIVSQAWVDDMRKNGDDEAWDTGNFDTFVKGGRYRSQWYQLPRSEDGFFAVGIHGQWLFVDRKSRTVIVKLSSQKIPQDDSLDQENLECLSQLTAGGR